MTISSTWPLQPRGEVLLQKKTWKSWKKSTDIHRWFRTCLGCAVFFLVGWLWRTCSEEQEFQSEETCSDQSLSYKLVVQVVILESWFSNTPAAVIAIVERFCCGYGVFVFNLIWLQMTAPNTPSLLRYNTYPRLVLDIQGKPFLSFATSGCSGCDGSLCSIYQVGRPQEVDCWRGGLELRSVDFFGDGWASCSLGDIDQRRLMPRTQEGTFVDHSQTSLTYTDFIEKVSGLLLFFQQIARCEITWLKWTFIIYVC